MKLLIPKGVMDNIVRMAKTSRVEVCGFLLGKFSEGMALITDVKAVENRLKSEKAFEMEPLEIVKVIDEAEEQGLDVVGIFHSHIECPPKPSGKDLDGMKMWPVVWLIVDDRGSYGAYILRDGEIEEVEVEEVEVAVFGE